MNYYNPTKIHFGNYLEVLDELVSSHSIALFYGQKSARGAIDRMKKQLWGRLYDFGNITPNPTEGDIKDVPETDVTIAIGGGSVIDMAKMASYSPVLIAIPTTNSGSEVTPFATLWGDKKESIPTAFPTHAIIDPELTLSMPPDLTACTGFDALSHAMEAYWSKNNNPVSDPLAISALDTILRNLNLAIKNPDSLKYRVRMSYASLWAGLAFSNTKTAAVHALSYPMTIHYGVPHGVACSLTLAEFWLYNTGEESTYNRIRELAKMSGLPTTLRAAGVKDIDVILDGVDEIRLANNPIALTRANLRGILQRVY